MERLSLIDVSSEDDFLIASSPSSEGIAGPGSAGNHLVGDFSILGANDAITGKSLVKMTKHMEQAFHMSECQEQKQTKSSTCNLRKSLAWDSAFFTNEGVLDAEELANVNSTFKKVGMPSLPSIAEDMRKSAESTSTLDNDSWLLENLEVDLFDNVRASIQKTLGHASKAACPVARKTLMKGSQPLGSSTIVESSSHNRKKIPATGDTGCVSNQRPKQVSGEANTAQITDNSGGTTSQRVLKPPRILSGPTLPTTSKGTLASRNSQKVTAASKVLSGKVPSLKSVGAPNKPNSTLNSNFSTSLKSLRPTMTSTSKDKSPLASCAIYSGSVSNSSDKASKPIGKAMRKKVASRNADGSSGLSTGKNPTKITRTRSVDGKANNTSECSTGKFSSSISPNSSFDSLASGSSSASFVFKPPTENIDSGSSCPSFSFRSPIKDLAPSPHLELSLVNESLRHKSLGQLVKGPEEISVISEPSRGGSTRVCNNIPSAAKSLKPSGLRLPTPKFGYFDAEKSSTRNVESFLHATKRSLTSTNIDISNSVMEIPPSSNLGTFSQIKQQNNSPQSTSAARNKRNSLNKLKPQTDNKSSFSMTMNPDCSPDQSLHLEAKHNTETTVAEQLPQSADIVEAFHESQFSVQKAPSPVKHEDHSKTPEVAKENKKKSGGKLLTAHCVRDGYQNSIANNPSEENSVDSKEEQPELSWKCSIKGSRTVAVENQDANQKQCHLVTTAMDKENILPADSSNFPRKNTDSILELLEDKISCLTILD